MHVTIYSHCHHPPERKPLLTLLIMLNSTSNWDSYANHNTLLPTQARVLYIRAPHLQIVVYLPDQLIPINADLLLVMKGHYYGIGKDDICCGKHSHPLIINPTYSSLFVNIEKVTILLRVKNSTAFATDDEFDRKKRWIARSWCGGGSGMRRRLSSDAMWTIATPIGGRLGLGKK